MLKPVIYETKRDHLIRKAEEVFFPDMGERRYTAYKNVVGGRRKSDEVEKNKSWLDRALACIIVVGIIASVSGFIYAVRYYANTLQRMENHEHVINMTSDKVESSVFIGPELNCASQEIDCWLHSTFDDQEWARVVLPKLSLIKIKGFKEFEEKGWVYYRIPIEFRKDLLVLDEELAFSPMYINHPSYFIYLNGQLVSSGNGSKGNVPIISIPRNQINDSGSVIVQIKGKMESNSIGIFHRGSLYVGAKSQIDALAVNQERTLFSYFLIFLFSKGAIFVVFGLFFFFSKNRRGLSYFLCFAFFTTLAPLYQGGFLYSYLSEDIRIILYFCGDMIAAAALLAYYGEYFQSHFLKNISKMFMGIGLPLVLLMTLDRSYGTRTVTVNHLFFGLRFSIVLTVFLGALAGLLKLEILSRYGSKGEIYQNSKILTAISIFYLLALLNYYAVVEYQGFDFREFLDMMFFVFVAFLTAKEFGSNEKRVNSFKEIKKEKERMEQELREAAHIANAFVPDTPPMWDSFNISAFHKPLTETSGDWYAFKEGKCGRFYHFIMCDVTGHGVQAALIVSACKTVLSMMDSDENNTNNPKNFIINYAKRLNEVLFIQGQGAHTSTFLGITFDRESEKIYFYSGAHPAPLLIESDQDKRKSRLLLSRNNPLGVSETIYPELQEADFKKSDHLLVYSDGIELVNSRRLIRHVLDIKNFPDHDLAAEYVRKIKEFELVHKGYSVQDDTTLICFDRVA